MFVLLLIDNGWLLCGCLVLIHKAKNEVARFGSPQLKRFK